VCVCVYYRAEALGQLVGTLGSGLLYSYASEVRDITFIYLARYTYMYMYI